MDLNFKRAIPLVLREEGGFVNNPKDPGGATNKGVTLATFRRYVKPSGTVADLKRLTTAQAETVYYKQYWSAVDGPALPAGVDYAVFDFAVNSGPARAAKYLQAVVGAPQDGKIGPKTIAACEAMAADDVVNKLCDRRMAFLRGLKTWTTFHNGWTARVSRVRAAALDMVGNPADVVTKEVHVPVPVEKPTVPTTVEVKVKEKVDWWGKLTGGAGIGGLGLSGVLGADWKTILAVGVVGIAAVGLYFLIRNRAVAGVKEVRAEVEA